MIFAWIPMRRPFLPPVGRALLLGAVLLTPGCSAMKETYNSVTGGEENQDPPTPLKKFSALLVADKTWTQDVGSGTDQRRLRLHPVLKEGMVYAADHAGQVTAVDAAKGRVRWEMEVHEPISAGPGVGEKTVVVGTADGVVIALDRSKGSVRWRTSVSSEVLAPPAVGSGHVIIRTGDGKIFALDEESGKRQWSYDKGVPLLTLRGTSAPFVAEDTVYVGLDSGRVVALELETGRVSWDTVVAVPAGRSDLERMVDIDGDPLLSHGTLYVATYRGRLAALSAIDGRVEWSRELSSYAGLAVDENQIYLTDDESRILGLARANGNSVWRQDALKARAITAPVLQGEYLVVGDFEGYVHWIRIEDGRLAGRIQVDSSPIIVPPLVQDESHLLVYSSGGDLIALKIRTVGTAPIKSMDHADTKTRQRMAQEAAEKDADRIVEKSFAERLLEGILPGGGNDTDEAERELADIKADLIAAKLAVAKKKLADAKAAADAAKGTEEGGASRPLEANALDLDKKPEETKSFTRRLWEKISPGSQDHTAETEKALAAAKKKLAEAKIAEALTRSAPGLETAPTPKDGAEGSPARPGASSQGTSATTAAGRPEEQRAPPPAAPARKPLLTDPPLEEGAGPLLKRPPLPPLPPLVDPASEEEPVEETAPLPRKPALGKGTYDDNPFSRDVLRRGP
jgi:outer membrane protein assembly factor BamB